MKDGKARVGIGAALALVLLAAAGCGDDTFVYGDAQAKAMLEHHGYRNVRLVPDDAARLNPQGEGTGPATTSWTATNNGYYGSAVRVSDGSKVHIRVLADGRYYEY